MSRVATAVWLYFVWTALALGVSWSAPGVEFVAQTGHTNAIDAVAYSPDGSLLASGGHDAIIKLWDVRTGSEIRALAGHANTVTSLAFSRDGRMLVSGSLDSTIRFWDVESGKVVRTIDRSTGVTSVAVSPDGNILASSGLEPEVTLWDFRTGNPIKVLQGHTKVVNSVSFSSDGRLLATASNDNSVRLWELPLGREFRRIDLPAFHIAPGAAIDATTGHTMDMPSKYNTDCVTSTAFSPGNALLATVSYNVKSFDVNGISFTITLWDVTTAKRIRVVDTFMGGGPGSFIFMPDHNSVAGSVSFSSDGKSLLATGFDYSIKQWDVKSGRLINVLPVITWDDPKKAHETLFKFQSVRWDPPRLPTFTPNGRSAAIVLENNIAIWDVTASKHIQDLRARAASVSSVSFGADGSVLASANSFQPTRLWNLLSDKNPQTLDRGTFPSGAASVAFSPTGDLLATAALDIYGSTVFVDFWNPKDGKKLRTLTGSSAYGVGIAFDLTGAKLAVGRINDAVTLFDVATGQKIRAFDKTNFTSNQVALSGDGRILVHAASGSQTARIARSQDSPLQNPALQGILNENKPHITVWNAETGAVLFTETEDQESLWAVAISRDGKLIASGGTKTFLWDVTTHHLLKRFDTPSSAVAFSPDGAMLAGASGTEIHIWNVANGAETAVLSGHLGNITSLAFDGKGRLASGSQDGSAKVWDLTRWAEVVTLFPLIDNDYVIATPDNYYMASRPDVRGVAFRVGVRAFPFEQFDLRYNRPDKVLERLGSAPDGELVKGLKALHQERVERMNLDEEKLSDDFHLPELRIVDPGPPLSSNRPFVRFTVRASDSIYELNRLNIYVDGVPIKGFEGVGLSERHAKSVEEDLTVPLANGQNKIQVSVVNEKGAESLAETVDVVYTGPAAESKLYLLAIGVSKYKIPDNNLKYAASDATAIEQFWRTGAGYFKSKSVRTLVIEDRNATKENILAAKTFLAEAGVNDVVVLFLAGHGVLDTNGKYYFGTWDFRSGVPSEKGLPYESIENLLDGISARKKLALIDTCHAGADDQDEVLRERFADLRHGTGAYVIAASEGLNEAMESNEFGSGTFSRALLDGLNGKADANGDREVTVSELRDYVASQVQTLSHGKQRPSVRSENFDLNFSLAKSH
jgi:WD40 repeat protein